MSLFKKEPRRCRIFSENSCGHRGKKQEEKAAIKQESCHGLKAPRRPNNPGVGVLEPSQLMESEWALREKQDKSDERSARERGKNFKQDTEGNKTAEGGKKDDGKVHQDNQK